MATVQWAGGDDLNQILPTGSGTFDTIGFFGAGGFGFSVRVSEWQDNTYSCNSNGTEASGALPNVKYYNAGSGYIATEEEPSPICGSGSVQMGESTLHISFLHDSAVQVRNAQLRAFDGVNINNAPSGVTVMVAEMKGHPSGDSQIDEWNLYGDCAWSAIAGTGALSFDDQLFEDTQHDFYTIVSCSPTVIGEKQFAFLFEIEYL